MIDVTVVFTVDVFAVDVVAVLQLKANKTIPATPSGNCFCWPSAA